jgi:hypothetical protein
VRHAVTQGHQALVKRHPRSQRIGVEVVAAAEAHDLAARQVLLVLRWVQRQRPHDFEQLRLFLQV